MSIRPIPGLRSSPRRSSYYALTFDDASHYAGLKQELDKIAQEKNIGPDRLFYLATAPEFFAPIIENLGAQGMAQPEQGRVGVVIEKPFGHDLDSARELNHQVNAVFHENQVFRIDHYLGKETVQNILGVPVSAMEYSSRSGIAITSTTCRSRLRKR